MPITVAILGATGVVGQKAIALLSNEPRFEIIELVASDERVGRPFGEICDWREKFTPLPEPIASMKVTSAEGLTSDFIISCLPAKHAETIEPLLASQGKIIFSNASTFRMRPEVPLLIPEVNAEHLTLLRKQTTLGKIITNPNCSATGITLALAPLMMLGEIEHISLVTLQSISGAGYPGVASLDILGNTIPHIPDEAEKITQETKKILGQAGKAASFSVTVSVHRVPVMHGHTATLHVTFKNDVKPEQAIKVYEEWNEKHPGLFVLHDKEGRPQSIKDLTHDDMRVHIGQLHQGGRSNILNLTVLTHNLVRGAAGAAISNMISYLSFQEK